MSAQDFSLRQQLAQFGLNPTEWRIFKRQENTYQFSHREDPMFRINVRIREGLVRIEQLSVVSI